MIDEENGWAIDGGYHILRTRDGGQSWKDVTPYYAYTYTRISYLTTGFFALDANTAWATSPDVAACVVHEFNCTIIPNTSVVWHTIDGGQNWQGQFVTDLPQGYIPMSMQFLDGQTGWMLVMSFIEGKRHYQLHQTMDSGTNWSKIVDVSSIVTPGDPHEKDITAIAFLDSQNGWMSTSEICCEARIINEWSLYRSSDGGVTWGKYDLPAPDPLPKTFLTNPAQCAMKDINVLPPAIVDATMYCYVEEGLTKPEFSFQYHSLDGGAHWTSFQKFGEVQFINEKLGWRTTPNQGAYDIERTQDGGITWTRLKTVQWNGSLHFVNQFVGWAIASSNDGTAFLQTVDGGRTWDDITPVVAAQ